MNVEVKSANDFGRSIRAAVRVLWYDPGNVLGFTDALISTIMRGYEQAWQEGASDCGLLPEDRTAEEQRVLDGEISSDQGFSLGFGSYIIDAKNTGKKWGDIQGRVGIWENRYNAIMALAQQTSCGDQKYKWVLGPTDQHCEDCSKYAGRVYRASTWGYVRPQSHQLACHGYNCACSLEPTDDRCTPGFPPDPTGGI